MNFKERVMKTMLCIRANLKDMQGMSTLPLGNGVGGVWMMDKNRAVEIVKSTGMEAKGLPDTDIESEVRQKWHENFSEG